MTANRIKPPHIDGTETVSDLVEAAFNAYNAARLREACRLYVEKMLEPDVTVGFTLSGAMTPAGIGTSCIVPLIKAGMIDWMVSTGANLYHDLHHALDMELLGGSPFVNDRDLKKNGKVRIYDIIMDYQTLLDTDKFVYEIIAKEDLQMRMGTAKFHHLLGKYMHAREEELGTQGQGILAAAWEAAVPIFTASPADSTLGLNVAAGKLLGSRLEFAPSRDVNESTAIVLDAKQSDGKSAVVIIGGGASKNFILQTEPQLQEVLGIEEKGHDYFLQITDARPDTGGLSGATPSEAVTWGKVDPESLPESIVTYLDATVALPILTSYALSKRQPRPQRRLYDRREEMLETLRAETTRWGRKSKIADFFED